jgi:hypothetical protein
MVFAFGYCGFDVDVDRYSSCFKVISDMSVFEFGKGSLSEAAWLYLR